LLPLLCQEEEEEEEEEEGKIWDEMYYK